MQRRNTAEEELNVYSSAAIICLTVYKINYFMRVFPDFGMLALLVKKSLEDCFPFMV